MRKMRRICAAALLIALGAARAEAGFSLLGVTHGSDDPNTYIVKAGDTLWGIAEKLLGSGWAWKALFGANTDTIANPDLILPGERLRVPGGRPPSGGMGSPAPAPATAPRALAASGGAPSADSGALERWKGGKLPPAEFFRTLGPAARASQLRTGVPASVTLAQAALETGWGAASIGDAKNLFGMKGIGPAGSASVPTQEFVNGRYITITDRFKKYHTWSESVADHAELLSQSSRYRHAMENRNNSDQFAREIQQAGYATDPSYASKLISIMKSNDLYQWDTKETAMKNLLTILVAMAFVPALQAADPEPIGTIVAAETWSAGDARYTIQKVHDARGVYVRALDLAGAQVWRSPRLGAGDKEFTLGDRRTRLGVLDLTGDGSPEIVTAAFHGPDASGLYVFTGSPAKGFTLVPCVHPEEGLSRPFMVSDRPAPQGQDLACRLDGTVRVLGRSFPDDLSGPPVTASYVYRYADGAYKLASVEKR